MIKKFKLKHLPLLLEDSVDFIELMLVVGVKSGGIIGRNKRIKQAVYDIDNMVTVLQNTDPKTVEENPECEIKRPNSIDDISFGAMMEIQVLLSSSGDKPMWEIMGELIALACFSENNKEDFLIESHAFKRFKEKVFNQPILDMFGLFNWIDDSLIESEKLWSGLFEQVSIFDADYEEAGGEMMTKFNVIETLKNLCVDFNVNYDKAWQLPYALSQTNSLSKATKGKVQDNMMHIKERKIKAQRTAGANLY